MNTEMIQTNQKNEKMTTEDFIQTLHAAEQHLDGVKVTRKATTKGKGKQKKTFTRYIVEGTRFKYVPNTDGEGPVYEVMTDLMAFGLDKQTLVDELSVLKDAGIISEIVTAQSPQIVGLNVVFVRMAKCNNPKMDYWPKPSVDGLSRWQLHSANSQHVVDGFVALINCALRIRSIPFFMEGQEATTSDNGRVSRGQIGHGLINILGDLNGPAQKFSLTRPDGNGISPGFVLSGRAASNPMNEADFAVHTMLEEAGIPIAAPPTGGARVWRRALDCNESIRGYFIDLSTDDDGLPQLQVVVTNSKKADATDKVKEDSL